MHCSVREWIIECVRDSHTNVSAYFRLDKASASICTLPRIHRPPDSMYMNIDFKFSAVSPQGSYSAYSARCSHVCSDRSTFELNFYARKLPLYLELNLARGRSRVLPAVFSHAKRRHTRTTCWYFVSILQISEELWNSLETKSWKNSIVIIYYIIRIHVCVRIGKIHREIVAYINLPMTKLLITCRNSENACTRVFPDLSYQNKF